MTIARKRNKYAGDQVCLNISAEDVIMQIDFLIKRLHGLLSFLKAIIEDLYEVRRRGRSMEPVKSLHESIQPFIVGDCVYLRPRHVLDSLFLLSSFCVLKFLHVIRVFNFLFRINGVIIKKLNYYFRQYKENQFIQYINAIALVLEKITITSTKYDRTP